MAGCMWLAPVGAATCSNISEPANVQASATLHLLMLTSSPGIPTRSHARCVCGDFRVLRHTSSLAPATEGGVALPHIYSTGIGFCQPSQYLVTRQRQLFVYCSRRKTVSILWERGSSFPSPSFAHGFAKAFATGLAKATGLVSRTRYTAKWYGEHSGGSRCSASAVVPLVMDLLRPQSVVDVGCGTGAWLAAFSHAGVKRVLGIDGSHVPRSQLEINESDFQARDLRQPFTLNESFDLALSLEAAEHLPESSAEGLVASLTKLAPAVLFSAAIPLQAGRDHINCQWPRYWVEKFVGHGYSCLDCLRAKIWDSPDVEWWYAQNILLFVNAERASSLAATAAITPPYGRIADLVHPALFLSLCDPRSAPLGRSLGTLCLALLDRVGRLGRPRQTDTSAAVRSPRER